MLERTIWEQFPAAEMKNCQIEQQIDVYMYTYGGLCQGVHRGMSVQHKM